MAAIALGLGMSALGGRAVLCVAAGSGGVLLAAAAVRRRGALAVVALGFATLVLAGGVAGQERLGAIDAPAAEVRDGAAFAGEVVALGRPRPSPFGESVEASVRAGPLGGTRLLIRVPRWRRWPPAAIGRVVAVRGALRQVAGPRPAEGRGAPGAGPAQADGGAAFAAHLRRRGIAGELMLDSARPTGARRGGVAGAVDAMRARSERAINGALSRDRAELLRGMVLGQDERIPVTVRDEFRASGLAHLLAVSGQNVMLLAALALPLLAVAGLPTRVRCAVLLALIALYVPLAGAGPSLQRAGVMGAAGVVALATARPASRAYALMLAVACTLLLNPRAGGDPGWQLSFAAVAGIVWLVPPLQRLLREAIGGVEGREGVRRRLVVGVADGAALTLVATFATAPLLAHHFGSAPVAGLPANLLALPAVAPAMWLGMLAAAVGQLFALGPAGRAAGEAIGAVLGRLAGPAVDWIAWLAERFAGMPGGQVEVPLRTPLATGAAYVALVAGVALLRRRAAPLEAWAFAAGARWRRTPRAARVGALAALAGALALAGAGGLAAPRPPAALTVRFLDVGQGDATLIQHPDGQAVLFDAGPPEANVAGLLRKAGVRRLALLVATHASRDHHGGLREVVRRFPVGVLLDGGDGRRDPELRQAVAEAERRGAKRVVAVAPLALRAGALSVEVLSPPPRPAGPAPEDPNPRGVVAVVRAGGFALLLSADAESEALAPLDVPDVDAMKVPHHGSADPGLPGLLERARPELAAIEVGRDNGYGHPAPSTLRALEAAGADVRRTDRDGTITLTAGAAGLAVETER